MSPDGAVLSTRPHDEAGIDGTDRWLQLISQGRIVVLIGAGLLGLLGLKTATAGATANGLRLEVLHATVTRPGIATPFTVTVATEDGSPLPATVTLRIDRAYLGIFDENGLDPDPVSTFQDDRWTWWEFDVPEGGTTITVSFDARLQPSVQSGRQGTVAVEVGGSEMVSVDFRTRVTP